MANIPKIIPISDLRQDAAGVLKELQGRGEIDTPHGRTVLGILIYQDLLVVPMMLAVPDIRNWLDPFMGIVGAALVSRWSYGLIRESARVLLDRQADEAVMAAIRESLEGDSGDRITDLHCWSIGPGIYAADLAIVSDNPQSPDDYRSRIPVKLGVVHATVEVHRK